MAPDRLLHGHDSAPSSPSPSSSASSSASASPDRLIPENVENRSYICTMDVRVGVFESSPALHFQNTRRCFHSAMVRIVQLAVYVADNLGHYQ